MSAPDLNKPFRIGDWRIHPALDEMSRGAERHKLEPRMTRLLCTLAARAGEVVSVNELLDSVWSGVVVGQGSVYQAIAHLRRLLGDTEDSPRYIATIPRKGYRLVAPVTADGAAETTPASVSSAPAPRSRRAVVAGIAAGIAAIAIAAVFAWQRLAAPPAEKPALAVLPFHDLSADASNAVFCEGLTDELLNSLARLPNLRVIGRSSAARYKDGGRDPRQIGSELGVSHLLEGSVRRTGGRLRVSAQLVSTADGFQLWSNSYDRPVADAIQIQTQIARAVVDALALRLAPEAEARLERGPTSRVNAYDLYLLGRHQQLQRTPESLERAIGFQRSALEADPGFALAHAGLADAYMARYYYSGVSLEDTAPLVQKNVDAALRLDPELAEAYAAWGVLLAEQWHTEEAIEKLKRALAINSNYGEAYLRLGAAYEYDGQPREALAAYDQVAVLDPLHTIMHVRRCLALQNLGRYEEAERACERGFELQPDIPNALWARGLNAVARGDLAAAIGHYRAALERAPNRADIRYELATLYLDLGLVHRASAELAALAPRGLEPQHSLESARARLAAGDANGAVQGLKSFPGADAPPRDRVEAGYLALAAGDQRLATTLAGDAHGTAAATSDDFEPGHYKTRWGVCELCALAVIERRRGDAASAQAASTVAEQYLDGMEQNGHVWHGLHYLRAELQASARRDEEALVSLERAVTLGWRRAWLMRADPAFESLRSNPAFGALLERIDRANAEARTRLGAG